MVFNSSETSLTTIEQIWVSEEIRIIFQWIFLAIGCLVVSVFGTVANIINILCFIKQGFKESVNVNFLGLAISDGGCLVTLTFISIGYNPHIQEVDKTFDDVEFVYLTSAWPHVAFARVTSLITALITVERCLCITIPLKVKSILNSQRSAGIIIGIYMVVICSVSPIYYANRLGWKFSHEYNRTVLGLIFTSDKEQVEAIAYAINNMFLPFISFMVIIFCTCVLVINLRKKSRWRVNTKAVQNAQEISNREQKVARMVLMISILFIACYFPICLAFIFVMLMPGMGVGGTNVNVSIIIGGIGFFMEAINSTLNIFIYYHMSSKYKESFHQLFKLSENI